jgi:hypothetical protein
MPNYRYPELSDKEFFISGDKEQFLSNQYSTKYNIHNSNILKYPNYLKICWDGYKNLNYIDTYNTFLYIYDKFKKGIYVRILNNKLECFLPFVKRNFKNEWSDRIKVNPLKYKSINELLEKVTIDAGYSFKENRIRPINKWYANNCMFRYDYNDTFNNLKSIKEILEYVCANYQVPNIEFFINKRDFPILKKDGTEPYEHLYGSVKHKLKSHNYKKYTPILSMVNNDSFADIVIPTYECWYHKPIITNYKWEEKIPIAIFRGTSTGPGIDEKTNMRIKAVLISNYSKNIDAEITKWNNRIKKNINSEYIDSIDMERMKKLNIYKNDVWVLHNGNLKHGKLLSKKKGISVVKLVSNNLILNHVKGYRIRSFFYMKKELQAKYKFILHIPGNVEAFRLSSELSIGSCILMVQSEYKMWFSKYLKEYVHYVPVKGDLSNLEEQVSWCLKNDNECKQIAINSLTFYNKYLNKKTISKYLCDTLWSISDSVGNYNHTIHYFEKQNDYEKNILENTKDKLININNNNIKIIHKTKRKRSLVELVDGNYAKKTHPQSIHETFIGLKCINKILEKVPHFLKTYYHKDFKDYVLTEYVDGVRFSTWIMKYFNWDSYIHILYMISLSMDYSFKYFGFIHWDLTPNNILIKKLDKPIEIVYPSGITISTTIIPIIIDYNTSHFIYNERHIGTINPFRYSSSNDIRMLILTSIDILLTYQKQTDIVKIFSFLNKNLTDIESINSYVQDERKYENMLDYKQDKNNVISFDSFINFLENNFDNELSTLICKKQTNNNLFQYNMSWTLFVCYHNFLHRDIPVYNDILSSYKTVYMLESLLNGLYTKYPDKILYGACIDKLTKYFNKNIKKINENIFNKLNKNILNCSIYSITTNLVNIAQKKSVNYLLDIVKNMGEILSYSKRSTHFNILTKDYWIKDTESIINYCLNLNTLNTLK